MKRSLRNLLCFALCAALCYAPAFLDGTQGAAFAAKAPAPTSTPYPAPQQRLIAPADLPARDEAGFLATPGEYAYENDEAGQWMYLSPSLQVIINQYADASIPLKWFETEIVMRGDERLLTAEANPKHPGKSLAYPFDLAARNHFVLGFTDDFYAHRVLRNQRVGIVIRNGVALSTKTNRKRLHSLPNLDMLAQFADGSLKTYPCATITADELLALGALNVFCFGPVLLQNGEIDPLVLGRYYESKEPRQALGMLAPNHYLLLTVQGRMKGSAGCGLTFVANLMRQRGVVEAMNLDGGNTMALIFRGRMLNKLATWKNKKFVRTVSSMIGAGQSESVTEGSR
ncbi:MAG: phosphodiester glycosidase family protein [Clostridia bacterium]